jgi:hypothetical protein
LDLQPHLILLPTQKPATPLIEKSSTIGKRRLDFYPTVPFSPQLNACIRTLISMNPGWILGLWALFEAVAGSPASAAVEVAFYSKELGASFPHAFVHVTGTVDANGEVVDASYGFTAKTISPAILLGSVAGEVVSSKPDYIAASDRHFTIKLSDEEYGKLLATIEKWRTHKQPSYNLNRRNCVFFVADLARTIGMTAATPKALMKKPRSYLQSLVRDNQAWLAQRGAAIGGSGSGR